MLCCLMFTTFFYDGSRLFQLTDNVPKLLQCNYRMGGQKVSGTHISQGRVCVVCAVCVVFRG